MCWIYEKSTPKINVKVFLFTSKENMFHLIFVAMRSKTIIDERRLSITLDRLCYELIENHDDFSHTILAGMQPRGVYLSEVIQHRLQAITGNKHIDIGSLDASFYRDDFRRRETPIEVSGTTIDFSIEGKKVILIDDVLYTGRMVRAALDALMDFGRPSAIEYLVLIDRRFSRELPVNADYVGHAIDSVGYERVNVEWKEGKGKVILANVKE